MIPSDPQVLIALKNTNITVSEFKNYTLKVLCGHYIPMTAVAIMQKLKLIDPNAKGPTTLLKKSVIAWFGDGVLEDTAERPAWVWRG